EPTSSSRGCVLPIRARALGSALGEPGGPQHMRRTSRVFRVLAGVFTVGLLAAACGGGGSSQSSSPSTKANGPVREGGDVVFAAEQEPDCADWIGSCAGSAWGIYTMQAQTMPRAFDVDSHGAYHPS